MNKRLTESAAYIERDRDNWRMKAMLNEPDALAHRSRLKRDREQKAAKRKGVGRG